MTSRRQFLSALSAPLLATAQDNLAPLNFVFILIDDLGWMDTGFSGSRFYETPAIDRLAQRSVRFTNAYAACPVCSPTRAAILTGKYPARLHLTDYIRPEPKPQPYWKLLPPPTAMQLPLEEVTIAEALQQKGYVSAAIGKWHLGGKGFLPPDQGFALNVGGTIRGQPRSYFYPQWGDDPPIAGKAGEYLTDRLTDAAIDFIRSQANRPFFLYLAHFGVHIPLEAKQQRIAHFRDKLRPGEGQNNAIYAAMIESVDEHDRER
jgi:arylsulfatase A